ICQSILPCRVPWCTGVCGGVNAAGGRWRVGCTIPRTSGCWSAHVLESAGGPVAFRAEVHIMFVCFRRRKRSRRYDEDEEPALLIATLVRCEREGGKPRQKVLAYLGSIRVEFLWATAHRLRFWDTADAALKDLDLDRQTRRGIEAALLARVP